MVDLMGLKSNPSDLSFFSALTLLFGSFDPLKPMPPMTYNVFGGTLNLALSIHLFCGMYCIEGDIKACPRCGALIVKMDDGSCNHMTCTVCAAEFCWLCMQEISDIHYLRYGTLQSEWLFKNNDYLFIKSQLVFQFV